MHTTPFGNAWNGVKLIQRPQFGCFSVETGGHYQKNSILKCNKYVFQKYMHQVRSSKQV